MVNGEVDFAFPVQTSQKVLFDHLGTPKADKHHEVYPLGGHGLLRGPARSDVIRLIREGLAEHVPPR